MSNYQKGFTMLELIIAMALGLLIIAAATGVFLAGQRSLATQSGMGDLQQNAMFGIAQLTYDLRHINLNTTNTTVITRQTAGAGVVFSDANLATDASITEISDEHITKVETSANSVFAGINNDQLTIQFKPHLNNLLRDCKGRMLSANEVNIQRYFIRAMPQGDNRFGLYCEASDDNFSEQRLIIPDVEAFKVRFGTKNGSDMQYKGIDDLADADEIISIEVGLIMRSTHNLGSSNSVVNDDKTYRIAGQEVQLINTSGTPAFFREVFSQVVAIRNSSGG